MDWGVYVTLWWDSDCFVYLSFFVILIHVMHLSETIISTRVLWPCGPEKQSENIIKNIEDNNKSPVIIAGFILAGSDEFFCELGPFDCYPHLVSHRKTLCLDRIKWVCLPRSLTHLFPFSNCTVPQPCMDRLPVHHMSQRIWVI